MTTVSQLRARADNLRSSGTDLRNLAEACTTHLDGVQHELRPGLWSGSMCTEIEERIAGWQSAHELSASYLSDLADACDTRASEVDAEADILEHEQLLEQMGAE